MITLIIGGSASGKSQYAETAAMKTGLSVYYIATMRPCGFEALEAIERHRQMRKDKGFFTVEKYDDIDGIKRGNIPEKSCILIECLGNLLANEMFADGKEAQSAVSRIFNSIDLISRNYEQIIIVTNDVARDGRSFEPATASYIEALSDLNSKIAGISERVIEVVCGIGIFHEDRAYGNN